MNPTIEIIVAPNGQTRIETHGFSGSTCQDASKFLEQALGAATSEQLKAEYHAAADASCHRRTQL